MVKPIDCHKALDRLIDHLSGSLAGEAQLEIEQHLETCKGCETVFRLEGRFDEYVKARLAAEQTVMSADAKTELSQRLDEIDRERAGLSPRGMWRAFALAAVLIIAVFLGANEVGRSRNGESPAVWKLLTDDCRIPICNKDTGIVTADFAVATPWLTNSLGTEAMVPTCPPKNLKLIGVTRCCCKRGVYGRADFESSIGQMTLYIFSENLYAPTVGVWVEGPRHSYLLRSLGDYRAVCWWGGGMGCILIGNQSHRDLMTMADGI